MNKFIKEEYYDIAYGLERYHEIFSTLWKITEPKFTDAVPTAAVAFNPSGNCIDFMINEEYWKSLDDYTKEFVICHEMCHVILNHGSRMIPFRDKYTNETLNAALDLAVNHLLTASFKFNRFFIKNWENLCWADTILKDLDLDPNKSFEYYISKIEENLKIINVNVSIGNHGNLSSFDQKAQKAIREAANAISGKLDEEEQKELEKQLNDNIGGGVIHGNMGGMGKEAGIFSIYTGENIKVHRIKKWESVLTKYIHKSEKEREFTQWVRLNRRLSFLGQNLLLPSDAEIIDRDFYKYNVWLFLDYSGSCSHLKNLFFKASETFDPRRFTIRKFAHTTQVAEFKKNECKVYGGGTDFICIENYIQNEIKEKKIKKYPDAIFHFTDGYGYNFQNEDPKKWYVFLTDHSTQSYYPQGTNFFKLHDFVENYVERY